MWKVIGHSARGTSHETAGQPCQDYSHSSELILPQETILILTCADGAGSAAHADIGARLACQTLMQVVCDAATCEGVLSRTTPSDALTWCDVIRDCLRHRALTLEVPTRDLACTLLGAVIAEHHAIFLQVGDGAIVIRDGGSYRHVFWPQTGEYANVTTFITQDDAQVAFLLHDGPINECALFTDGLQSLALDYSGRSAHAPFFEPLFRDLRNADLSVDLHAPLTAFLTSPRVNERTDDDKTLILASRMKPDEPVV